MATGAGSIIDAPEHWRAAVLGVASDAGRGAPGVIVVVMRRPAVTLLAGAD